MVPAGRPQWRKSSYSTNGGEACVEVASVANLMLVRDSKHPDAGTIEFTLAAWAVFVRRHG